ncbi:STAS domain-containing protein [Actinoallomurus sp. NBC_01490]|jgi:anti-sigma B factor antagonist|uniref:STAS domain-containing protein n=1 Tax=Actinoallomurus sp. NBC_01490 TaxID=2903557 RepID=UPI002E33E5C2|nr:STAS domain-containing protein [Actinoallomurus sp. NBC_01490]
MYAMTPLQLPVTTVRGDTVAVLPSEIDAHNAPMIRDALFNLLDQGVPSLIVDLTGTNFCDCAGLRALTRVRRRADVLHTPACVALPDTGSVRRVAELSGFMRDDQVATGLAAAHRRLHPV